MPPKTSLSPTYVFLFVALCVLLLALPGFVHAQQPPTPEEINAVAKDLYCPLCNGVRLDTCELQACEQMREVIGEKLTEGVPKAQIMDEFVAQYGPVVLGEPPAAVNTHWPLAAPWAWSRLIAVIRAVVSPLALVIPGGCGSWI